MNPSSDGLKYSAVIATNLPKFQKIVTAFYENLIALPKEILSKIERVVTNEKTIMTVAELLNPTARVDQMFCTYIKKLIFVAAVSYQTYPNPENALTMDVFVSLMGVASAAVPHPTLIHSWHQNGIGIFLFCPGYQTLRKNEIKCQTDCHLFTIPRSVIVAFLQHDWFP